MIEISFQITRKKHFLPYAICLSMNILERCIGLLLNDIHVVLEVSGDFWTLLSDCLGLKLTLCHIRTLACKVEGLRGFITQKLMYSICLLFNHCCSFIFFSVPPLFVIEFLHRVVDTFTEYFNSCTETSIKENVVIVFEVRRYNEAF